MKRQAYFFLTLIATMLVITACCDDDKCSVGYHCVDGDCEKLCDYPYEYDVTTGGCTCMQGFVEVDGECVKIKEITVQLSKIEYFCPQRSTVGEYLDGGVDYTLEVKLYIDNLYEIWADISFDGKELTSNGVFSGNWRIKVGDIPESYEFMEFSSDEHAELSKEDTDINPDEFYDYDISGNLLDKVIVLGNTRGQDFPCEAGNPTSDRTQLKLIRFNDIKIKVREK